MKKYLAALALVSTLTSCSQVDLAKTLRYNDNRPVALGDIQFQNLQKMNHGESCGYNFLYVLPIFGNSSILTAAQKGKVNNVKFIGETGFWTFPFNQVCTVVYGD